MFSRVNNQKSQQMESLMGERAARPRPEGIKSEGGRGVFVEQLTQVQRDGTKMELDTILKKIDEFARNLSFSQTVDNLKRYKESVKKFMNKVMTDLFQLKEETRWDREGNNHSLITVQNVDDHLKELTDMVLDKEYSSMDVLRKTDEIRGLLIDVYT